MTIQNPKLVAFDLDYTLWPAWVDCHVDPPLKRRGNDINRVFDRTGDTLSFYKDVPSILLWIHQNNIHLAAASRTPVPDVARQALRNLYIPYSKTAEEEADGEIAAVNLFDTQEIYPGSKLTHFKRIHEKSGIPYDQMVFYDDEIRNKEVETKLGVTFIYIPNGMSRQVFDKGLDEWRRRQKS